MPNFRYIAYDTKGRKKEGIIESQSKNAAVLTLKKKGIYIHSIESMTDKKSKLPVYKIFKGFGRRVSQKSRADMFFQLATLIDTGIPLPDALSIAAEQAADLNIKNALKDIKDNVSEGKKISVALLSHKEIFTESYIRMIEIAEKTGKLADILFKISQREEDKSSFNQKILPIVLYPAFVLTLGLGIVSFLLVYVVPKMEKIFSSFHKNLPVITRMLITSGMFIKHYFIIITLVVIIFIFLLKMTYSKNHSFRKKVDGWLLKLNMYRKITIAQFTSALAFQLNSNIKLTEAVENSSYVVKNGVFIELMKEVSNKINSGEAIDAAFKETNLFDSMFIASLAMGRKTGKLPQFMQRISVYYEKKLDALLKTTIALIEPVAILSLGLIVGFIVMAIMVPLFNINQLVK